MKKRLSSILVSMALMSLFDNSEAKEGGGQLW